MSKITFDVKDRRILSLLDKNPNMSVSKLSKETRLSPQVVEYRIKRLLFQKSIYAFYTLIDPGVLGHTLFRINIKLKNISETEHTAFANSLFNDYPTFWVAFVSGPYDIIADIWAENVTEFEKIFNKVLEKHRQDIQNYEINSILEIQIYEYGYFLENKTNRLETTVFRVNKEIKIDSIDNKILKIIKTNSRMSYEAIAKDVGLTRNAVKYRIQRLEKQKIIAGYKMMVDFTHFDRTTYKIFIKYDTSKVEQEKKLLAYLRQVSGILAVAKHLGKWNMDIEIEPKDARELQKFIIALRNTFDIIQDYELVHILDDYGIDYFPDKLRIE